MDYLGKYFIYYENKDGILESDGNGYLIGFITKIENINGNKMIYYKILEDNGVNDNNKPFHINSGFSAGCTIFKTFEDMVAELI